MDTNSSPTNSVVKRLKHDDTVTISRSTLFAALIPVAFLLGLGLGYFLWGSGSSGGSQAAAVEPTQAYRRFDVATDGDPQLGPDNAPITIIEFSDFECPFCKKWYNEIWPSIQKEYGDKVRLVYRDFPLSGIHQNAISAAVAANCAIDQGKYWEYHTLLFSDALGFGSEAYQEYAQQLGLDLTKYNDCLKDGAVQDEINADYQYATNMGVSSTPTFFVNGIPLVGAQPFTAFKDLIDKELAGKIPQ